MGLQKNDFIIIFLVLITIASDIELELIIPTFPAIVTEFNTTNQFVQLALSINFFGFFLSGLFYGPLSDMYGRRNILLFGSLFFIVGSLGVVLAKSIESFIVFRFIQGIGASAANIISYAVITDLFSGKRAEFYSSLMNGVLTLSVSISPVVGSLLNSLYGWQSPFLFLAILSIIAGLLIFFFFPETKTALSLKPDWKVFSIYNSFFYNKNLLTLGISFSLLSAAFMSFTSVAPFYYLNNLNISVGEFGYHISAIVLSFSLGNFIVSYLSCKIKNKSIILLGSIQISLATILFFLGFQKATALTITFIISLFVLGIAFLSNIIIIKGVSSVDRIYNGAAFSFILSMRILFCASSIAILSLMYNNSLISIGIPIFSMAAFSLFLLIYSSTIRNFVFSN